jgi:peptide/nickel transport system permease protein
MWTPKRIPAIWRRPGMVVGAIIVLVVVVVAVAAPILAPADPNDGDIMLRLQPPVWLGGQTGLMGTDQLGRDVLSRAIYGARVSLIVGSVSVLLAGSLGLVLGLISGYAGRQVDNIIMRLTDIQMAFPFILLALAIIAILGPGIRNMIIVFAVTDWTIYARTIRGAVLSIREKEFVEAARGLGGGHGRIIIRHILPSVTSPLIVISSFEIAKIIIYEASLSFLGLGVPQAIPSWGQMLADGREYIQTAWWVSTFPGLPLMITVLGINFIGDGLRDALDPRLQNY